MVRINELLIQQNQDFINYVNADSMFNAMKKIIEENGRDFILKEEHQTDDDCVRSYCVRSQVMRYACDAIEHYAKAILIQNGSTWSQSKSWGHNLLELITNLDIETRRLIYEAIVPIRNNFEGIDNLNVSNMLDEKELLDEMTIYLYILMNKYGLFSENIIDVSNYQKSIICSYLNEDRREKEPYIKQSEHIVPLHEYQSISGELEKLNPTQVVGQPKQQVFGVKARFPGQFLVDGNAEFLISLAYAMNAVSDIYRKKTKKKRHG